MEILNKINNLKNKTILITGATGYLGREFSKTFSEIGSKLICIDSPDSDFEALTSYIGGKNLKHSFYECNLEVEEERAMLFEKINSEYEVIDVAINNAAFVGTSNLTGWISKFEEQSVETWRRAFEVNLTSIFDIVKNLTPLFKKSESASIINISSIYASSAPDHRIYEETTMGNSAAYAASKGGLNQLTKWLSTTLAPNIRVNSVSPGGIYRGQPDSFVKNYISRTPMLRMGTEEDMCGAVVFLASDLSLYITGQNLIVDGGWSVW